MSQSVAAALAHTQRLIDLGVPVFVAPPDIRTGVWNPKGGTGGTGYWLPTGWQTTVVTASVLDSWRPGYALCAVMGRALDVIDVDPRNGGTESMKEPRALGVWPDAVCKASTPSGGEHYFVPTMGVGSPTNVWPGIDIRGGTAGQGHGFVFIAPTVRLSKTSGVVEPYGWLIPPPHALDGAAKPDGFASALRERLATSGSATRSASPIPSPSASQSRLAAASPCEAMLRAQQAVETALVHGPRHEAILGRVLHLVRLTSFGHSGVTAALDRLEKLFIEAVAPDRSRGGQEAREEWQRALDGAWSQVRTERLDRHAICRCRLQDLRRAMADRSQFSQGKAGQSERQVLRVLLYEAERQLTSVVRGVDQRSIAGAIDTGQPVISRALRRLEDLGWIGRLVPVDPTKADPIRLLLDRTLTTTASSPLPAVRKGEAEFELNMHHRPHRLFGSTGLSTGVEETLAALAEKDVAGDGDLASLGVIARPGSTMSSRLVRPWSGRRQIPRPMSDGRGRTLEEIAAVLQAPPTSIRRHLAELRRAGLAMQEGRGSRPALWWRTRFDPDVVADERGVVDTVPRGQARHARDRELHREGLRTAGFSLEDPKGSDGSELDVDLVTGEVLDL